MLFSCHNCIIYRGEEESGSEKEEDEEEEFLPEEKKKKSSVAALSLSVILLTGFSKNPTVGWFICSTALQ